MSKKQSAAWFAAQQFTEIKHGGAKLSFAYANLFNEEKYNNLLRISRL